MTSDNLVSNPAASQLQPRLEPELNLVDIVFLLFMKKHIILVSILFGVLAGGLFAGFEKQVYRVETRLLPPILEHIEPLNVLDFTYLDNDNDNARNVKSVDVFNLFIRQVQTRKLKKTAFDKLGFVKIFYGDSSNSLTDSEINDYFEGFSKSITIEVNEKNNTALISFTGTHKNKIGKWLDRFVALADLETRNLLINNLEASLDLRIKSLKADILNKKLVYKQKLKDELARLQGAYDMAKTLGIHDHLFIIKMNDGFKNSISAELNDVSETHSKASGLNAYVKGTKILQAKINALLNRKSDDAYIIGLRSLEGYLARLESIKIDRSKLQTVIVDKPADISVELIKPNKTVVVFLSFILGGVLGIFAVFLLQFLEAFKVKYSAYKANSLSGA